MVILDLQPLQTYWEFRKNKIIGIDFAQSSTFEPSIKKVGPSSSFTIL